MIRYKMKQLHYIESLKLKHVLLIYIVEKKIKFDTSTSSHIGSTTINVKKKWKRSHSRKTV